MWKTQRNQQKPSSTKSKLSKVAGYKISIQKPMYFCILRNKQLENEIFKTLFTIA